MGIIGLFLSFFLLQPPGATEQGQALEVTGKVVDSVTGQPLANAMVTCAMSPGAPTILSDASGNFRCQQKLSRYGQVSVVKAGYSPAQTPVESAIPGDDAQSVTLRIEMRPFAVVEGTVVNEDGEPLPGIRVQLMRGDVQEGQRRWQNYAANTTDDRGHFRLWRLTPGEYVLKAMGRYQNVMSYGEGVRFSESESSYGPQYYPQASTIADAETIRLEPGTTLRADFRLAGRRAYAVFGRVLGAQGYASVTLQLLSGKDELGTRSSVNPATGVFRMSDVPDGSYLLRAWQEYPRTAFGETAVTVRGGDTKGVQVQLWTGVRVDGQLTYPASYLARLEDQRALMEKSGRPARMTAEQWNSLHQPEARLRLIRLDEPPLPRHRSLWDTRAGADGKFTFEGVLPGRYTIEVTGGWGLQVAAARAGGVDALEQGLLVGPSGGVRLDIELSSATGTLKLESDGTQQGGYQWVWLVRRLGTTTIALRAGVLAKAAPLAVPVGEYTAYVTPSGQELEYRNPAVLESLSSRSEPFTVTAGREITVKLKVKP